MPSTTYDADASVYAWWGRDLPAAPHEPRQPDGSDMLTKVVMATVESWEAKSRWFFEVNDGQFDSSPEIDAAVRRILEEAGAANGSDDRKAEALLHWVAQNIRYSGQTMGKGEGFTLHSGDDDLRAAQRRLQGHRRHAGHHAARRRDSDLCRR